MTVSKSIKIIVGTRPQIIKLASLVGAFDSEKLDYSIIHTGQHYDFEMDQAFFEELELPKPEAHLGVGSGTHAFMTGTMIVRLEKALEDTSIVIVPGDTNSALAGGLAAVKMGIRVGHVEAGLRCYQPYMPEEINRLLVDHMSELLFAPTKTAQANLNKEGIEKDKVHLTGDVMADNIHMLEYRIEGAELPVDVTRKEFVYATIHRTENVDEIGNLRAVVEALIAFPEKHGFDLVLPLHPHTKRCLEENHLMDRLTSTKGVHIVKPLGYLTSLRLARDARMVFTDSGGLQKEAFMLGTPTVTARGVTEWVETVETGWSRLTGTDPVKINSAVKEFLETAPDPVDRMSFYGNGNASTKIAKILRKAI